MKMKWKSYAFYAVKAVHVIVYEIKLLYYKISWVPWLLQLAQARIQYIYNNKAQLSNATSNNGSIWCLLDKLRM